VGAVRMVGVVSSRSLLTVIGDKLHACYIVHDEISTD